MNIGKGKGNTGLYWRNGINMIIYLVIFGLYLKGAFEIGQLSWLVLIPAVVITTNKKSKTFTLVFETILTMSYLITVNTQYANVTLVAAVTGALSLVYIMYFIRDFDK